MSKYLLVATLIMFTACGSEESQTQADAGPDVEEYRPVQDIGLPEPNTSVSDATMPDPNEPDMASEEDEGLVDPCPNGCATGVTKCQGTQVQFCVADPANPECGVWEAPMDCASPQQTCVDFQCEFPTGCVDNDSDGFGLNCANGPDCDDNEAAKYPGATEICDSIDNDCDGDVDEGFTLNRSCSVGTGSCASTGVYVCNADGLQECMVTSTGTGSPEVCDGIDNDCDGDIDDEDVCDVCALDPNEPNDTIATATPLTINVAKSGITCAADEEYFAVPTTVAGKVYGINLNFYDTYSDLDMKLLANGVVVKSSLTTRDYEILTFTAVANTTYTVQVVNAGNALNVYRIAAIDVVPCVDEDTFYPNGTRGTAAFLFPGWVAEGHVCNAAAPAKLSDWFSLGTYEPGETIDVLLYDLDGYGDLDLFLFHDPDGDGTFTEAAASDYDGTDEDLFYTVTTAGSYFVEVRDYAGVGAFYELEYDTY